MPPRLHGRSVLVVDDDEDNLELVTFFFASAGAEVRTAKDAREALRALASWVPDVIVSDLWMPEQDGYALLREVRRDPRLVDVPALALTAAADEKTRAAALAAGFDDHVPKPVNLDDLGRRVDAALAARRRP